uniref:C-type lectin domain-containing protein n=1 Tax=Nothobranchius furzeri TaxID=105023 RepID=A0A8C6M1L6_NOTFU
KTDHTHLSLFPAQSCVITCQLHEYLYVGENKSWSEAQRYCRDRHTDLATVSNMADMKRLIRESSGNRNEAWIGLRDQTDANRTWHWSLHGVEFNDSQTNWRSGAPTERQTGPVQSCGVIYKDLTWSDHTCDKWSKTFVCYDGDFKLKWPEAQRYCSENHTDLVSGWHQTHDPELTTALASLTEERVYAGLFRDTWRWSDGSRSSFRLWNLQFNMDKYNTGQCAMAVFDDGGRWKSDNCSVSRPFVCYDGESLIQRNIIYKEALFYCRDHHHDLVTITNTDDQRLIQEKVKNASTTFVWIGLYYCFIQNSWFWVSDQIVCYDNWVSGGPENDCGMSGAMQTDGQHQWVKRNETEEFNFICSKF